MSYPLRRLAAVVLSFVLFTLLLAGLGVAVQVAAAAGAPAASQAPTAHTITVTTTLDDFTNNGNCSLREAIEAANTGLSKDACVGGAGPTTIVLARLFYPLTITTGIGNSGGALKLAGEMTLQPGPCSGLGCSLQPVITANPGWTDRLLRIMPSAAVKLQSLTVTGANNANSGAAIFNEGELVIEASSVLNNVNTGTGGGALYNADTVHISGTLFSGNEGSLGGALANAAGGTAFITSTTMSGNQASLRGGAIDNAGSLAATGLTLSTNTTDGSGGGLYNLSGRVVLVGSIITNNTALGAGGGLANYDEVVISQTRVLSNAVVGVNHGGGLFNAGDLTVAESTVSANRAAVGGGIRSNLSVSVISSAIITNTATTSGGGLSAQGSVSTNNATFSGNMAPTGGGVYLTGAGTKFLRFTTIAGNQAGSGPGLWTAANLQAVAILLASNTISGTLAADDCYSNAQNLILWTNVNLVSAPGNCNVAGVGEAVLHDVPAHLGPLGDYGGPTLTHRPYVISPAVDGGTSFLCPPADQRGQPRPTGPACDIGAVEGAGPGPQVLFVPLLTRGP